MEMRTNYTQEMASITMEYGELLGISISEEVALESADKEFSS